MSKNIVVTGGSSGIGAAVVARLRASGCHIWNIDLAKADSEGITHVHCDLADPVAVEHAIEELPSHIHGFISVAGLAPGVGSEEQLLAVNFLSVRLLIERLQARVVEAGSMVIVASSAGRDWRENLPAVEGLLATQGFAAGLDWLQTNLAVWQDNAYKFSKQCAAAYTYRAVGLGRDRGVRVNCINPGIVETPLSPAFRSMLGGETFDYIVNASGRAGQPDEIAAVAEYLLVGDCAWLNGVELTVDGGYYAGLVGGWINPP
ncbi:MAG: SDR family oxidoreductase [Pseudomonadota bacterium]